MLEFWQMDNLMQLPLFITSERDEVSVLKRSSFSHDNICAESERKRLEEKYGCLLEETDKFNRKLVSFQGNRGAIVHGWIRYKEGFSAQLVEGLIREFGIAPGDTLLDPFGGSATTLLVAKTLGIDAMGLELLPVCHLAWQAKSRFDEYDLNEVKLVREMLAHSEPGMVEVDFPHIRITEGAFSETTENALMFYSRWFEQLPISETTKTLCRLLLVSILEEVSYTRKDGQYLRWDYRSPKLQQRYQQTNGQGKQPVKKVDKGELPTVKEALLVALGVVTADIQKLQALQFRESQQRLVEGNALFLLPGMAADQFAGVITSPPYCNRYDYTRTYALELAYLGVGEDIYRLRQEQLSCTVENRSKLELLEGCYREVGRLEACRQILQTVQSNGAYQEINEALQVRKERGEINNRGVLPMVEQYFTELTFIFAEVLRTCRPGALVAFVNDNVRYGGEVIPVDLLTTELAEDLGFEPVKIYVLPQRKGNSSQQMGKFGREALRKSITIWRKPYA
jgi:site-specific DNA-methyltransferase (cytosine-N4-specific)